MAENARRSVRDRRTNKWMNEQRNRLYALVPAIFIPYHAISRFMSSVQADAVQSVSFRLCLPSVATNLRIKQGAPPRSLRNRRGAVLSGTRMSQASKVDATSSTSLPERQMDGQTQTQSTPSAISARLVPRRRTCHDEAVSRPAWFGASRRFCRHRG
ncbi:hypothetical protein BKA80DRAFT_265018 [Phyllosticta citrichinensis]